MKVYALTKLGLKVAKAKDGTSSSEEMRVLGYVRDSKTATEDELGVVADTFTVRRLKKQGLLQELTT